MTERDSEPVVDALVRRVMRLPADASFLRVRAPLRVTAKATITWTVSVVVLAVVMAHASILGRGWREVVVQVVCLALLLLSVEQVLWRVPQDLGVTPLLWVAADGAGRVVGKVSWHPSRHRMTCAPRQRLTLRVTVMFAGAFIFVPQYYTMLGFGSPSRRRRSRWWNLFYAGLCPGVGDDIARRLEEAGLAVEVDVRGSWRGVVPRRRAR